MIELHLAFRTSHSKLNIIVMYGAIYCYSLPIPLISRHVLLEPAKTRTCSGDVVRRLHIGLPARESSIQTVCEQYVHKAVQHGTFLAGACRNQVPVFLFAMDV